MTTVGYGDQVPATTEGKIIAVVLMVAGIALFGVFTGLFARLLIDSGEEESERRAVLREIQALRERIEALGLMNGTAPAIPVENAPTPRARVRQRSQAKRLTPSHASRTLFHGRSNHSRIFAPRRSIPSVEHRGRQRRLG